MIEFSCGPAYDVLPAASPPPPAIEATRTWLEKAVIGLNLCPFAKAVHVKRQIRYAVSDARDTDALAQDLADELHLLAQEDASRLDTSLLVHPHVLLDFFDYNDFLSVAEAMIDALGLSGVIQVASFHPGYCFAESKPDDIENHTNRSPFPMLHLLREESIARAVEAYPDAATIYERNIETLRKLGHEGWNKLGITSFKASGSNEQREE